MPMEPYAHAASAVPYTAGKVGMYDTKQIIKIINSFEYCRSSQIPHIRPINIGTNRFIPNSREETCANEGPEVDSLYTSKS